MALSCQVSLSYASYAAGQNPPPMASVLCVNATAAAIIVTDVRLTYFDAVGTPMRNLPLTAGMPPLGPGQTVSVPAASSITIGPFPVVMGCAANANSFAMVDPGDLPANPQPSQPPQSFLYVGATVMASDGSINTAGAAGLLVSFTSAPPQAYQGGYAQFAGPNNSNLVAVGVG